MVAEGRGPAPCSAQRAYLLITSIRELHNDSGSPPTHPALLLASTHFLLLQLIVAILSLLLFSAVGSMTYHAAAISYSLLFLL